MVHPRGEQAPARDRLAEVLLHLVLEVSLVAHDLSWPARSFDKERHRRGGPAADIGYVDLVFVLAAGHEAAGLRMLGQERLEVADALVPAASLNDRLRSRQDEK